MKLKTLKIILNLILAVSLVIHTPLAAFAQEASQNGEPQQTEQVPESSPLPEPSPPPAPTPPPGPPSPPPAPTPPPGPPSPPPAPTPPPEIAGAYAQAQNDALNGGDAASSSTEQTGGENNSGNSGDTTITTGDATATATVDNNANQNSIDSQNCQTCQDSTSITNIGNGAQSDNSAAVNSQNNQSVDINNDANITNNGNLGADSGDNQASYNVGDSEIITGNANVSATVINSANETGLGIAEFNIVDNHIGDIILTLPDNFYSNCGTCQGGDLTLQNKDNGASSQNSAEANFINNNETTIDNTADVLTNLNLDANTGDNATSFNTGGNSTITTGNANIAANVLNAVNTTILEGAVFVVNIFGDLIGDIIFPDSIGTAGTNNTTLANTNNGAYSNNNASQNSSNYDSLNIDNNANIENNLNIDATTGDNETNFNTGGQNLIDTGDVDVNAQVVNVANVNLVGTGNDPIWLILVNNMGTWTGKIMGALAGNNFAAGEGLEFTVDPNGNVSVANSGNGAQSENTAAANFENSNNTTINNNANLVNNINIDANTGGNKASYNTGGDSKITTGNVNVAASIVNFVNTVIIGRPLMVGIINIFGSWTGNAVPPGQDPEVHQQATGGTDQSAVSTGGSSTNNSSSNSSQSSSNSVSGQISSSGATSQSGLISFILGNNNLASEEGEQDSSGNQTLPAIFGEEENSKTSFPKGLIATIPLLLGALFYLRRLKINVS